MKRLLLMVGLLSLLAVASACGGGGEKEITLPGDGGNVKITTGGDLPEGFPSDFPTFEGADLMGSMRGEQEGQSGFFVTWETGASTDEVTNFYKEALDKDPWKTSGVFTTSDGAMITFSRADNENFGGGVTVTSSDGKTQFVVFMGEGAGAAPTEEAAVEEEPTPEKEATPEEGQPATQAELPDEVALPDGYPSDVAPIADGARVTEASSFTTAGQTTFAVSYLTKDDPESIADFYSSKVPGNGWSETSRVSSDGDIFLSYQNEANGGQLMVSVASSTDYEGYTEVTLVLNTGQ